MAIEDYAMIGDLHTAALISQAGSIDWLCLPRFDTPALAALLGSEDAGRWSLAPNGTVVDVRRSYMPGTFVLQTHWQTDDGEAEVWDFMPPGTCGRIRTADPRLRGRIEFREQLAIRFDYGTAVPWVRQITYGDEPALLATAGPDAVIRRGPKMASEGLHHVAEFTVGKGEVVDLILTWYPSHRPPPTAPERPPRSGRDDRLVVDWAGRSKPRARTTTRQRSLLVLRALTDEDTGGISAAATTSLPETEGASATGTTAWLRDAALTISVLLTHGYHDEAEDGAAGCCARSPATPGTSRSCTASAANAGCTSTRSPSSPATAVRSRSAWATPRSTSDSGTSSARSWSRSTALGPPDSPRRRHPGLQRALLSFLEDNWQSPDCGIWEIRGAERHFTHSRAMVWAASIAGRVPSGSSGCRVRRRSGRRQDRVREEILERGYDPERNTFVHYDTAEVDASLLQLPQIGFIEADDPRMLGTVAAINEDLMRDGLLLRYRTSTGVDGLAGRSIRSWPVPSGSWSSTPPDRCGRHGR